jgi:ligand-binding SRPBCC domain-containing protein
MAKALAEGGGMRFRFVQYVAAPTDAIAAFYSDARNLLRISPPFPRLRILSEQSRVEQGRTISLGLDFILFRVRWDSCIERHVPGEFFTDTFDGKVIRRWTHTHRFSRNGNGTMLTDEISCEPVWWAVPFVWVAVQMLFVYRRVALRRLFE